MRWNLDSIYKGFDEDYKKDFDGIDKLVDDTLDWMKKELTDTRDAVTKTIQLIEKLSAIENTMQMLASFPQLKLSCNATDKDAMMWYDRIMQKTVKLTEVEVLTGRWFAGTDVDELTADTKLKEYEFLIKEHAEKAKYLLSDGEEWLIANMKLTGVIAWETLKEQLDGTHMVDIEIDGEMQRLPLPMVRNMAYESDADVREKAYYAEIASYKNYELPVAASLNAIKGEALTLFKKRGYKSPLEKTLIDSRMDEETLDAMIIAMKESLPKFRDYLKCKAKLLGYEGGLPFYDLFAPIGKADKKYSWEEARTYLVDNFKDFSDEMADYVDMAFEKNWIDAEPREGKAGGAFCVGIHPIKESRILSNFSGSLSSVLTLAHELGHGWHNWCIKDEPVLKADYPMPLAETASIFNETLITQAALKTADDDTAKAILESSLQDSTQVIVDIYSRYLFESSVFTEREDCALSVDKIKELMIKAQQDTYGDGLDNEILHPYMWACKPHYYYSGMHYYNFPYAFGLLFGLGVYNEYVKRGEVFLDDYKELLAATGCNDVVEVAKMMDIDVHSVDFWRGSIGVIADDIDKFIEISSNKQ